MRLILQMHPVTYLQAVQELMKKSYVKELRLKQYKPKMDFEDIADQLTEHTSELIIKPKKRGDNFGTFWDLYKNKTHEGKNRGAVEIMNNECSSISAVIDFEGTKRVFSLSEDSNPISSIEFDEENVKMKDGLPILESLNVFSQKLLTDLIKTT